MSTYRTSIMLCSSVLALGLVAASDGFCSDNKGEKEEKVVAVKTTEATAAKEKAKETKPAETKATETKTATKEKESNDTSKKNKNDKKDTASITITDAEEDAEEKKKREQIEQAQKKRDFTNRIETIRVKYAALLSAISGEPKENIAQKLGANSEKVRAALLESLKDSKTDVYEKLSKGLKRKNKFIQSKKESVGDDDAAWFDEVFVAAEKQLKRLEKLNAEFEKNKGNATEQEKTRLIYADRIKNFLASYDAFTACTHYLGSAKAYCNDSTISFNNMKVQFPDFSSKAFKEAGVPADILSGKRDPFASIKGFKFYAIGKIENTDGKFSSRIPADSEDGIYLTEVKKKTYEILLNPENGGVILSSNMIQKPGMDRPVCVFSSYAVDGKKETIYRFSLVHESEEVEGRQLTAQLIQAENQPAYDELAAANGKLKKALAEAISTAGDPKKAKEDKTDKSKEDKTEKKSDKPKEKVKEAEGTDKPKEKKRKADADASDSAGSKKKKTAEGSNKSKEGNADKPKEDKADKPKSEGDKPKPEDKPKSEGDKPRSEGDKQKATGNDKSKTGEKPKKEVEEEKEGTFFGKLFG